MRVLAVLQIEAELRKQPGECNLKRRCASSPVSANSSGVAQAARWVQTVAELRKRPGECNLAELRKQPGDVWPEVNHRTARAVPLALPAYALLVIFEKYESLRAALKFV